MKAKVNDKRLTETEMDEIVIAEAGDENAWIRFSRNAASEAAVTNF